MVENIIFYLIMLFFAFIALGANWKHRYSYTKIYLLIIFSVPILVLIINTFFFNIAAIFDIREIFSYSGDTSHGQLLGRIRVMPVGALILGIVAYLTISLFLIMQLIKRITRRSS